MDRVIALLDQARKAGLKISADNGNLRIEGDANKHPALMKQINHRKADLLAELNGEPIPPEPEWGPVLRCMADINPRQVNWLWPKRIAAGRITLLVGLPGAGKSFLTCDMASRVSTGTPWPDGTDCQRGSVILVTAEDDPHDTIRPRLDAHYADVARIHLLSAVRRADEQGKEVELMFTLKDVDDLEVALQKLADCKLIIVDPIGSFLGGRTDAHRDNEVRSVLAPIAMLAEQYGPAVPAARARRAAPTIRPSEAERLPVLQDRSGT
jgi:hypothetical protein